MAALDAKRINNILKCILKDEEVGERVLALTQAQVPRKAKFAALTQEQRRWLGNVLTYKYAKQLTEDELRYYRELPPDSKDLVVQGKEKLLTALGGGAAAPSSAAASSSKAPPAPPVVGRAPVPQRPPKAAAKRKLEVPRSKPKARLRKSRFAFGRKRLGARHIAESIAHYCGKDRRKICGFLRSVVTRVDAECPGVKQELLRDAPVVDNLLLQSLSRLREEALSSGFQSVAIRDVDFMISKNGSWSQEFLKKQGYPIGRKAWATVQKRAREGGQLGRREVVAQLRGGGRKKVDHSLLEVTRQVLLQHAKPGSTVAHVHRNEDGTLGQARRRGEKSQEAVVSSQSLWSKPARIWQEHPEIRQRISRSGFYKLIK